jgi:hypothetical protein
MDIGINGIKVAFHAVDDDLAKLLGQVESFKIDSIERHALGTSDVILLSNKGLSFIERPLLEDDMENVPNSGTCGCDSLDKPLEPVEVPSSTINTITLLTEEGYNALDHLTDKPLYSELGSVAMSYSVEGGYSIAGTLNPIKGHTTVPDGAIVFLELGVTDYVRSCLGVMAVDNPDKVVMTVACYNSVTNVSAIQLYTTLDPVTRTVMMPLVVGVEGLTAVPDIVIKTDWDGGSSNKFAKYTTTISMKDVVITVP